MPGLTLQRSSRGHYTLGEVGTLRELPRFAAQLEADGASWTVRRAMLGMGQTIRATDTATGAPVASYVPSGFLHLRGIYRGTIRHGDRTLAWRANRQLGHEWNLTENGVTLAHFTAGSQAQPAHVTLDDPAAVGSLLLLLCCHIVKQSADTAKVASVAATASAAGQ